MDKQKTLEEYLGINFNANVIDHQLRAHKTQDGRITFYIHPANVSGVTYDYAVVGNELHELDQNDVVPAAEADQNDVVPAAEADQHSSDLDKPAEKDFGYKTKWPFESTVPVDITKHPLLAEIYDLALAIESIPAGREASHASGLVGVLLQHASVYVEQFSQPQIVRPSSEGMTIHKYLSQEINFAVEHIHGLNVKAGWWSNIETGERKERNVGEMLMLIVSELAEAAEDSPQYNIGVMEIVKSISRAMEGHRKSKMDDKLPHRKAIEVELADAMIRILDLGGGLNLDLGGALAEKMAFNAKREDHKIENRLKDDGKKY